MSLYTQFEVGTAERFKIQFLWDVPWCGLVISYLCSFVGCLALNTDTLWSSEMASISPQTPLNIPKTIN